jgi:hypothetical protein
MIGNRERPLLGYASSDGPACGSLGGSITIIVRLQLNHSYSLVLHISFEVFEINSGVVGIYFGVLGLY